MKTITWHPFTYICFDGRCIGVKRPNSLKVDAVLAQLPDGRKKVFASVEAVEQWAGENDAISVKV